MPTTPTAAETPAQRAERLRQEALAASAAKVKIAAEMPARMESDRDEALSAIDREQLVGAGKIRRAGAEQLSSVLAGAPRTGAGARLAVTQAIGDKGLRAEADFGAEVQDRASQTRLAAAEGIRSAEAAKQDAILEDLKFQKEAGTAVEDFNKDAATALADINAKMSEYTSWFGPTRDPEGASKMIETVALTYKTTNPNLYNKLYALAGRVRKSKDLENGYTVSPADLGV